MAFNEADMEVFHTSEVDVEDGRGTILVRLFSWKGGPAKISLTRRVSRDGEPGFAKLGGVTLAEAVGLIDGVRECLAKTNKPVARKKVVKKRRRTKERKTK